MYNKKKVRLRHEKTSPGERIVGTKQTKYFVCSFYSLPFKRGIDGFEIDVRDTNASRVYKCCSRSRLLKHDT